MKIQFLFHHIILSAVLATTALPVTAQTKQNECPANGDIAGRIIKNTAMAAASGLACVYFTPFRSVACSAFAGTVVTTYEILQENCDDDNITQQKEEAPDVNITSNGNVWEKTGEWEGISGASNSYDGSEWHGDGDMLFKPGGDIYERVDY